MSTVTVPQNCPSPSQDCQEIQKALKGRGVDEERLVKILAHRSASQRKEIREIYQRMYKEDLIKLMDSKLHGKLQDAMIMWMLDSPERDALIMHRALKSWCKDYNALTEVICTRTTREVAAIAAAYRARYKKDLEEDIASETSGMITKLLLALIWSSRSAIFNVNLELVRSDARSLYEAGSTGSITNGRTISGAFSMRSREHLQATLECYQQIFGQDLKKALKKRTGGAAEDELRAVIKCLQSPANYFAKVLNISMRGLGTDDDVLTRVIVTRAEVDMQEIKRIYLAKFKVSLESRIAKDTRGNFEDFLLELIS